MANFQKMNIPYALPAIGEEEVRLGAEAIREGWGKHANQHLDLFESAFAKKFATAHSIATSSCTGALVLALRALGVEPGMKVALADANWVAAASAVLTVGAKPVFVDVDEKRWCMEPSRLKLCLEEQRIDCVIVTYLYGNLAPIRELLQIANSHGVPIIEDAAEAIGSKLGDNFAGTFGNIGVFSFHGTKTMTTGEGGMLITNSDEIASRVRRLNNHGREAGDSRQFFSQEHGYKFRMSNVQAAIGIAQLEKLDELVERKREIFFFYLEQLQDLPLTMNFEGNLEKNSFWMPTVILSQALELKASQVILSMKQDGVDTRPFFWPLSSFPFLPSAKSPVSLALHTRGLNLPSFHSISNDQLAYVVQSFRSAVTK